MKCIYCGRPATGVVDSRHVDQGNTVRRRRQCRYCGKRFTTFEKIERIPVRIRKRNGTEEQFDAEKLRRSICCACPKHAPKSEMVETVVEKVEHILCSSGQETAATCEIAQLVFSELLQREPMTALRYASVQFEECGVEEFIAHIRKMTGCPESNEEV